MVAATIVYVYVLVMHNVNDKGAIGVARIVADLISKEYSVFLPFDGSSPVDIVVANKAMVLRRIQAKYRKLNQYGSIPIRLESIVNRKTVPIDRSKVDGYAVYCPDNDKIYYLDIDSIPTINFDIAVIVTNRSKNIASKFLDPKVLWKVKSSGTAGAC